MLVDFVRALNIDFKNQMFGPLTLAVCIATYPNRGERGEMVMQAADIALYKAKGDERNRVVVAVPRYSLISKSPRMMR
jgi:GGDEF domain-containing protein